MGERRLEVRLDAQRDERLRSLAEHRGATVSQVVRDLVDEAYEVLRRERRVAAAARFLSLPPAGPVPDDPRELKRQILEGYERVPEP